MNYFTRLFYHGIQAIYINQSDTKKRSWWLKMQRFEENVRAVIRW